MVRVGLGGTGVVVRGGEDRLKLRNGPARRRSKGTSRVTTGANKSLSEVAT